jgi:hypothetical protein
MSVNENLFELKCVVDCKYIKLISRLGGFGVNIGFTNPFAPSAIFIVKKTFFVKLFVRIFLMGFIGGRGFIHGSSFSFVVLTNTLLCFQETGRDNHTSLCYKLLLGV